MKDNGVVGSVADAVGIVDEVLAKHPERNGEWIAEAAWEGRTRPWPGLYLGHQYNPADPSPPPATVPGVRMPDSPEGRLARAVVGLLGPLELLNPIRRCLGLGRGTGTLVTAFGISLNSECGDTPAFVRSMSEVMAEPPQNPATAGLMPEMLERIEFLKEQLPPKYSIALPDLQGPFNLMHAIAGDDALTGPYENPELFERFMARIADYWLAARGLLMKRIGAARLPFEELRAARIAECSVNLVSPDTYLKHILPHDLRIAAEAGRVAVHTCSGPHVFRATLAHLPVAATEAGRIPCAVAGYTEVDDALAALRGTTVLLNVGQELPDDFEEAYQFVLRDFDRYAEHRSMLFSYTGMQWRVADRPRMVALHRRLDAVWAERYGATATNSSRH